MKKIITSLLVVLLSIALIPLASNTALAEIHSRGDWEYYISDGEATIVRYSGYDKKVIVPSTLGGCPVTCIEKDPKASLWDDVFWNSQSTIQSVTLPDGLKRIGNQAFHNCRVLESISIPSGVESIGYSAFFGCESLKSIEIPDSVKEVKESAFSGCSSLEKATVGSGVTRIEKNTFNNCTSLQHVSMSSDVTFIGNAAFINCPLTDFTVPSSLTEIGDRAFSGCDTLKNVSIPSSVISIGDSAFSNCHNITGNLLIPSGVKDVCEFAFFSCKNLTGIRMLDGVETIGYASFYDCASLTSVILPSSVKVIERDAFSGCDAITDVWYGGTETEWELFELGSGNNALLNATIHFNSDGPLSLRGEINGSRLVAKIVAPNGGTLIATAYSGGRMASIKVFPVNVYTKEQSIDTGFDVKDENTYKIMFVDKSWSPLCEAWIADSEM